MMKYINFFSIAVFTVIAFLACQKETSVPVVSTITFSQQDVNAKDSIVTSAVAGVPLKIIVMTDANENGSCVVWPAGIRDTIKSNVNPEADSIDSRGIVMVCDDYQVYQAKLSTGVSGYSMDRLLDNSGYSVIYEGYTIPGTYNLVFFVTRDGTNAKYKTTTIKKTLLVK